jgi:hypothetical protein
MPLFVFGAFMLFAGIGNVFKGYWRLGACRLAGVSAATILYFALYKAIAGSEQAGLQPPFLLIALPYIAVAIAEASGRIFQERSASGLRLRAIESENTDTLAP